MKRFQASTVLSRSACFRPAAIVTLCAFVVLLGESCVSYRIKNIPLTEISEEPSIFMSMYLKKPQKDQETYFFHGVESKLLFETSDGTFTEVATSNQGNWVLKNAPAGRYRIDIADSFAYNGETQNIEGSKSKSFDLKPQHRVHIRIILKKVPVGWIVVFSVLLIGLIILVIVANNDNLPDLGRIFVPPLPSPGKIFLPHAIPLSTSVFSAPGFPPLPNPPIFVNGGVYMGPGPSSSPSDTMYESDLPPEAVSFYPQSEQKMVAADVPIQVYFSHDMDETTMVDPRIIRVIGTESGLIEGNLTWVEQKKMLVFTPKQDFKAGERVTVTIMGKLVRDSEDRLLAADYEWFFVVGDASAVPVREDRGRNDKDSAAPEPVPENEIGEPVPVVTD